MLPPPVQKPIAGKEYGASNTTALLPIDELIMDGLQQSLSQALDVKQNSIILSTVTNRMENLMSSLKAENKQIEYPYLFLKPATFAKGDIGQGFAYGKSLSRHGTYLMLNDTQTSVLNLKIMPVLLEYEVFFITESFAKILSFSRKWLFATEFRRRVNFTLTYYNTPIDITVELGDNLIIPERENSIEMVNYYEINGAVRVYGYISDDSVEGATWTPVIRQSISAVQAAKQSNDNENLEPDSGDFL